MSNAICTCGDTLGEIDPECPAHFPSRSARTYTQTEVDKLVAAERERCTVISEIVNDSIKAEGKFAAFILNPETCLVPLSGGGKALQPEHVFDNEDICVHCAIRKGDKS